MKRLRQLMVGVVTAVTLLTGGLSTGAVTPTVTAHAATTSTTSSTVNLKAKAGIAVDAQTGQILYEKNGDQTLPVASMSKLLSIYLVLQAVHAGKLKWDQKITISKPIAKVAENTDLSNVPLRAGHSYTVKSLYQASLIYSANGAIEALGSAVAGSPHAFVTQMKAQAKKLGMTNVKIYNACGLTNKQVGALGYSNVAGKAENEWSAADQAKLAVALLNKYPEVLQTTKIAKMWFEKGTKDATKMENWNWMLKGLTASYTKLHVDGLKTGTSDAAGANFTGTAHNNGNRIITVVLHAAHKSETDPSRFQQTQKMMSYVYNNFKTVTYHAGQAVTGAKTVTTHDAKEKTAKTALADDVKLWLRNDQVASNITAKPQLKASLTKDHALEAPVTKNQQIGTANLSLKGDQLGFLGNTKTVKVPLKVTQSVEKANVFVRMWRWVVALF
ncbi:D-alanyl-D-alanine carboxypeptidase family protein [Levilactobacillus acidifarinae]|uniref:serine-type D-Ala-D-Ala carboxypeptidase n=1 Tax=Levilactobacillus acidifarinae DSM 19394 = JCM 15949 TaxID=1423715 RepID=A0A0R1LGI8_9LACO|nr:D-alanyl-D-alanine carboxypeptidase family protein [Levilactobacillus acidifarinae]KRK94990.1 D-alanyl-D-alanine carboxypeptidase [Levilactobacillus acidifarinae DSM 19394]GEO70081.1 D-alanyl-D-alanine carboxypeptidase [Levilactobacillus acidifarinae]